MKDTEIIPPNMSFEELHKMIEEFWLEKERTGPSILQYLKDGEYAKYDPYTDEALEQTKRMYSGALAYMKTKDFFNYNKHEPFKEEE